MIDITFTCDRIGYTYIGEVNSGKTYQVIYAARSDSLWIKAIHLNDDGQISLNGYDFSDQRPYKI